MTSNFKVFAPTDDIRYFTEDTHKPRYLTPIDGNDKPYVFLVRSELEAKEETHNAIALFNYDSNIDEPELNAFLVERYGIVPAKNLICEGLSSKQLIK